MCEHALHTVFSRALACPAGEGGQNVFVLHPELEWCNHNPEGNIGWRCEEGVVTIVALRAIAAGEDEP